MSDIEVSDCVAFGVRSRVRSSAPAALRCAREAVVFVHGNPGSSEDWLDLLASVGEFARAVAPDMPGFGQAERPRSFDHSVPGFAHQLGELLRALGVERAHLVLHDFGGAWGLMWAREHPEQVASLTLINVGVAPGYRWHRFARIWQTPILGELSQLVTPLAALRRALNADNPKPFPDAFLARMHRDMDAGHKRAVLHLYRASKDLASMSEAMGEALRPLHLPALVLWGEGDRYMPVRFAEVQKQYFDADVHRLQGCGHWPMIDAPERVRELVLPFLRRQLAREAGVAASANS